MKSGRVIVVGGGYAGLAAVLDLSKAGHSVTLVSESDSFLRLVLLHRSIHTAINDLRIPFADLARRYRFEFCQARAPVTAANLSEWSKAGVLRGAAEPLPFDALVVATGARAPDLAKSSSKKSRERHMLTDTQLVAGEAKRRLELFCEKTPDGTLTVVGGGPTGVQYLFELADFIRLRKLKAQLRLVTMDEHLLAPFPERFHEVVLRKAEARGMRVMLATAFRRQDGPQIEVLFGGDEHTLPSDLTILCPGVQPHPEQLQTDEFGRVRVGSSTLSNVFAAGDCSLFEGRGLNSLSAQAATRKGKVVAENVGRTLAGTELERYNYREIGYFISLGYWDGVGWLGLENNVLSGLPALAIKEAVEAQFELFVSGWDTYLNPFRYLPV